MYLGHFGFNEPPFRITPHTDFFFEGANRGATLEALLYAIAHDEGIVKVSGEVGSGKTMLCRVLMERLAADVEIIYLANPSMARDEILFALADEMKLDVGAERSTRMLRSLQEELLGLYSQGRRVVVLIDEAQAMPQETLEEIRLLSNLEASRRKLLQIVLFGQPELDAKLNAPEMRPLKERITHSFRLAPLVRAEIGRYIEFRLRAAGYRGPNPFTPAAIRLIAHASRGLTRRVNILADKGLLAAFAANSHTVGEREIKRAIQDSDFCRSRATRGFKVSAMTAAAGIAAGFCLAWLWLGAGTADGVQATSVPVQSVPVQPVVTPVLMGEASARTEGPDVFAPHAALGTADAAPAPVSINSSAGLPVPPHTGTLARERFFETQAWLEKTSGRQLAIQLMTVAGTDLMRLEDFLRKASRLVPQNQLHVYSVKIGGAQHYRAAYGGFDGSREAAEAMQQLPPPLSTLGPYTRSVARMRSQNRQ